MKKSFFFFVSVAFLLSTLGPHKTSPFLKWLPGTRMAYGTVLPVGTGGRQPAKRFRVDSTVKGTVFYRKRGGGSRFVRVPGWTPAVIYLIPQEPGVEYEIKVEKPEWPWHIWRGETVLKPDKFAPSPGIRDLPAIEMKREIDWERGGFLIASVALLAGATTLLMFVKLRKKKAALERELVEARTIQMKTQLLPSQIGQYKILSPLGEGGFARVYKAEDSYGDIYALKVPRSDLFLDGEFRTRFLREVEVGKTLHHPNIVRICDYADGSDGKEPYIAFEFVDGVPLHQISATGSPPDHSGASQSAPFPVEEGLKLLLAVLSALEYAHGKGVVHRDIKPQNIMVTRDGTVKIMDFGIARVKGYQTITMTGVSLGTPAYMAPEQIEAGTIDQRTDLYAVGVLAYEYMTGRVPFEGDDPYKIIYQHLRHDPLPPGKLNRSIPQELERIILKLLQKDPDRRFSSATEVMQALSPLLQRLG